MFGYQLFIGGGAIGLLAYLLVSALAISTIGHFTKLGMRWLNKGASPFTTKTLMTSIAVATGAWLVLSFYTGIIIYVPSN